MGGLLFKLIATGRNEGQKKKEGLSLIGRGQNHWQNKLHTNEYSSEDENRICIIVSSVFLVSIENISQQSGDLAFSEAMSFSSGAF